MLLSHLFEVSGLGELDVSEQLQRYFTKRGYNIVSEGRDQMVFHRPGQRHVIKVIGQSASGVERGEAIADYVRFFAQNQRNPHFPRVSHPRDIDVGGEIYTIYRQELLQDLSDDEEERLLDWMQAFGQALGDPMGPGMVKAWLQNNPPPRSLPLRQVQGVYAAVMELLQYYGDDLGNEMRLDLGHAANFMQRADGTIVVVDPIAYDEEYGTLSEQGVAEAAQKVTLGPQLFVDRRTTVEDIKPRGVAWTSTAEKTTVGYTSAWVEWCKDNMAQWLTDTGILYDVAPGARILVLRTDRDVIQVARHYKLQIQNVADLFGKMDWNVLRQDYDAIHHIPTGRDMFMSTWDVESTAWFDRKFLINPRKVPVDLSDTSE